MAALNGYFDCVQLLLDINASVTAVTFHYGTSMDLIGVLFLSLNNLIFLRTFLLFFVSGNIVIHNP